MYRDILVQLDGTPRATVRLDVASTFTKHHGERLIGLFAHIDPDERSMVARRSSSSLCEMAAAAEVAFRQKCADVGVDCEWMCLPFGEHNFIIREIAICSRYSDLTILGQFDPTTDRHVLPVELNEEIILQSGGPVLVVPYAGTFPSLGKKVLLAWNGSREAARALRDALPVLAHAQEVRVLGLHARIARPEIDLPQINILNRLKNQGIKADYEVIDVDGIGPMDFVLSRAADDDADMIVMGGFGGYGLPGFSRGAGTRHMLRHMTVPVMFSH